jgi:uncharacterized protein with ParB-like and HNH nuclease domain
MRINDDTIKTFKDIWMKYDPRARGLIRHDNLRDFVLDLIEAELKLAKANNESTFEDNILFNLRLNGNLAYYAEYKRGMLDDRELSTLIYSSSMLSR